MLNSPLRQKKSWIEQGHDQNSLRRQCELLGLNRSTLYYQPETVSDEEKESMRMIDEIDTRCPFYGSRRITAQLNRDHDEEQWNRQRIQRLMRSWEYAVLRLGRIPASPILSTGLSVLLRGVAINEVNHVW